MTALDLPTADRCVADGLGHDDGLDRPSGFGHRAGVRFRVDEVFDVQQFCVNFAFRFLARSSERNPFSLTFNSRIATKSAVLRNFKCAYQARFMKMLERISRTMVFMEANFLVWWCVR